ncbi:MAG: type II secretion system GspH family protein [Burkholderiales bacterium]|nr:type II secretion system GspH family protein [Burkholderiales bacterium]
MTTGSLAMEQAVRARRAGAAAVGPARPGGVTLVELVVVMTILGVLAIAASIAVKPLLDSYSLSVRRAELTDVADGALRRMARDARLALPNSLRIASSGTDTYLELLLTKTGGRYRAQTDASAAGDVLRFDTPDGQFDTLGSVSFTGQAIAAGDVVVVYNLNAGAALQESNAYTRNAAGCGAANSPICNSQPIASEGAGALANERRITLTASRQFPVASPGNRFHVVSGPVTFACRPGPVNAAGDATGTLVRHSGYPIALVQPTAFGAGTSAVLAGYVEQCEIAYDAAPANPAFARNGIVALRIKLTRGGDSVTLYHETHVDNLP